MRHNWGMTSPLRTVVPVWVVVAVGALLVGLLSHRAHYLQWLPILMAGALVLTFCSQLVVVQKEGLVDRVVISTVGTILILSLATLVLGLIAILWR